jgi:hypothetical protein
LIPVTHESFNDAVIDFADYVVDEIRRKNADYSADSTNPFEAFDEVARVLGMTREQVWAVYYLKHVQALTRYIKTGMLDSENIQSRLTDLAAYPAILSVMLNEELDAPEESPTSTTHSDR